MISMSFCAEKRIMALFPEKHFAQLVKKSLISVSQSAVAGKIRMARPKNTKMGEYRSLETAGRILYPYTRFVLRWDDSIDPVGICISAGRQQKDRFSNQLQIIGLV